MDSETIQDTIARYSGWNGEMGQATCRHLAKWVERHAPPDFTEHELRRMMLTYCNDPEYWGNQSWAACFDHATAARALTFEPTYRECPQCGARARVGRDVETGKRLARCEDCRGVSWVPLRCCGGDQSLGHEEWCNRWTPRTQAGDGLECFQENAR